MAQFLLQCFKFRFGIIIIPFKLCQLLKTLKEFLTFTVIFEATLQHCLLEIFIISIRNNKILSWSNRWMSLNILQFPIPHNLRRISSCGRKIESNVRQRVRLYLYIRLNTTTVTNLTSICCMEHMGERIWNMLNIASIRVFIIDSLYTSATRDIIFTCGQLQTSIIRKLH